MFQCQLKVNVPKENLGVFTSKADVYHLQEELLYRDKEEIAVGHGVGVDWVEAERHTTIYSTWVHDMNYRVLNIVKLKISRFS